MPAEKHPAVYMLASRYRGTLYIGVTSSLWQRVLDHKNGRLGGFTEKYAVKNLVWYEHRLSMEEAIRREKQLKKWNRAWKIELIESVNPDWRDLHKDIDVTATLVAATAGPPLSRGVTGVELSPPSVIPASRSPLLLHPSIRHSRARGNPAIFPSTEHGC